MSGIYKIGAAPVMLSKPFATGVLAATVILCLSPASAAGPVGAVARIQGTALINQGERYVSAHEGMAVKVGDRLIVTEGSSAVIKFKDGCEYTLDDAQVLTVGPTSTCAGGGVAARYPVNPKPAVAPAAGGAFGGLFAGGAATAGLVAVGTLATVVAVGVVSDTGSDSSDPAPAPAPAPAPQPISP